MGSNTCVLDLIDEVMGNSAMLVILLRLLFFEIWNIILREFSDNVAEIIIYLLAAPINVGILFLMICTGT